MSNQPNTVMDMAGNIRILTSNPRINANDAKLSRQLTDLSKLANTVFLQHSPESRHVKSQSKNAKRKEETACRGHMLYRLMGVLGHYKPMRRRAT